MLTYLQRIEWFIGLVLLQVLVLNHMHINGYATPFFFIYFILKYNSGVSRNVLMIWAFLLGLTVDILGNTPVGECEPQAKHEPGGIDTMFLSEHERYAKCELRNMV